MTRRLFVALVLLFAWTNSDAQPFTISGKLVEQNDTAGLIGANVFITPLNDTSLKNGTATDFEGRFTIENVQPGQYILTATYIGFDKYTRNITVSNQDIELGNIRLGASRTTLETVVVAGQAVQATQTGDTTNFNASAYKTNPDASAEDLVTKMPGVTSEDGTLKVGGEDVREILVDGKPFFGDDPSAAIKNLPAEIIERVQVFDKASDQEQFTGFNSGDTRKTINIITKPGKNTGKFGKVYAGYGTDDRYTAGGNINFFKGAERITILGLSNNINQQNFSTDDLLGVTANVRSQNRGGNPRGNRGNGGSGFRGGGNRGGDAGNFLVGQQGGITQTHALGLNYSNEWGKKLKLSGSYFYNNTTNNNNTELNRQYITGESDLRYEENSATTTKNQNHRINARLEYTIDSSNSLIVTPRLSFQDNSYDRQLNGGSFVGGNGVDSRIDNRNASDNFGYNLSNNILFRHRFAKRGRTVSVNVGTQMNNRDGEGSLYSLNEYTNSDTTLLDQQYLQEGKGYTLSSNINYTEPISTKGQLMFSYSPSHSSNNSDKQTFNRDPADQQYDVLDTTLSNKFDNTYTTHRGGVSYRHNDSNYNFNIGIEGQYADLEGQQYFPLVYTVDRSFRNILPNASFNYKFSRTKNLRFRYRSSTNPPSISQLQNVVDITNPLILRTGNPNLVQDYDHNISLRYGATNTNTSRNFFAFGSVQFTQDYIGNATFIPTKDSTINEGVTINRGAQLNMPVNLDGYLNARGFLTYGLPIRAIKSNLNLNGGLSYSHIPALINSETNFSNTYNFNGGFNLGSNISEKVDFNLNFRGNYNIVKNTLQADLDNTYYFQNTALRFNWLFLDGFVFNTDVNHNLYTGLSQDFNQSFLLWNAGLGYKFLKNKSLEAKLNVYDILNQNRAISRTVTETYIEDSFTQVLQRYFMLTLTYKLRNFQEAGGNKQ